VTDNHDLIYSRHLTGTDDSRRRHARAAATGAEVRISRGAYLAASAFDALDDRQRYLLRIRAVAETRRTRPVISHWSAAAVHGLPMVGRRSSAVHITQSADSGLRSANGVVRHSTPLRESEIVEIEGMLVTSVSRTVIDLASSEGALAAVTAADAALHVARFGQRPPLTTPELLRRAWELRLPFRGHARSLDVIEFAVTNADTPIESVSRVTMRTIGCPAPALQVPHFDSRGFIGEPDFYWKEYNLIGEADGDQKYLDAAHRSGRSAERVVLDEKIREDRLRAIPRRVVRWRWPDAMDPTSMHRILSAAGIRMPPLRGRRW
jgi:hypothetical protein